MNGLNRLNRNDFAMKLWSVLNERNRGEDTVTVIDITDTFKRIMALYPDDFIVGNKVKVRIVNNSGLDLPTYATEGSACIDLRATFHNKKKEDFKGQEFDVNCDKDGKIVQIRVHAGGRVLIPTGLFFELPPDYMFEVRPRSGLALNYGITVANSPGTLDEDYRGELGIIVINHGDSFHPINHGDKIAQGRLVKVSKLEFMSVAQLSDTTRGSGGFGSTGK